PGTPQSPRTYHEISVSATRRIDREMRGRLASRLFFWTPRCAGRALAVAGRAKGGRDAGLELEGPRDPSARVPGARARRRVRSPRADSLAAGRCSLPGCLLGGRGIRDPEAAGRTSRAPRLGRADGLGPRRAQRGDPPAPDRRAGAARRAALRGGHRCPRRTGRARGGQRRWGARSRPDPPLVERLRASPAGRAARAAPGRAACGPRSRLVGTVRRGSRGARSRAGDLRPRRARLARSSLLARTLAAVG